MRELTELPAWERLFKKIVWAQLGDICEKTSLISEWVAGLNCKDCFGIRTFWDLQQNQEKHNSEEWQERMISLEIRVSQMDEYRNIAFFHHLLFVKEV